MRLDTGLRSASHRHRAAAVRIRDARSSADFGEGTAPVCKLLDAATHLVQASLQLQLQNLPELLECSRRLRTIDRYLCGIDEIVMFFFSAKQTLAETYSKSATYGDPKTAAYADLEARKAIDKVSYGRRLCTSHIEHVRELVQMVSPLALLNRYPQLSFEHSLMTAQVLLHQSTLMNQRLDRNNSSSEILTKLGLGAAGIASILTPLSFLTSYFGMNVEEFVPGTTLTLFDFWTVGIPTMLATAIPLLIACVWMCTKKAGVR